jgi:hypothetical protein
MPGFVARESRTKPGIFAAVYEGFPAVLLNREPMDDQGVARPVALLPEAEARALLAGRQLRFRLLAPPWPALGVGLLRVLRVSERADRTEIVAGYERYERVETVERRGAHA